MNIFWVSPENQPGAPVVNFLPRCLFLPPPWLCMCVCIGVHIYTFVLGCSVHVEIALIVPIMGDNYSFFWYSFLIQVLFQDPAFPLVVRFL